MLARHRLTLAAVSALACGVAVAASALLPDDAGPLPRGGKHPPPKVATSLQRDVFVSPARQHTIGRYDLAVLNLWISLANKERIVQTLRQAHPGIILGQYTILSEARDDYKEITEPLQRHGWWLRDAGGQRVQWTASYGAWETNITRFTAPDAEGRRWPEWKADHDSRTYFDRLALDFVESDTVQMPSVSADWKGQGSNQSPKDAELQREVRLGHVAYWNRMRERHPDLKLLANIDPQWLASPEMTGRLNGVFIEGAMGKPWSQELRSFDGLMARYLGASAHLREPRWVLFNVYAQPDDLKLIRYGLATALLGDGYYCPLTTDMRALWLDEFEMPLGRAAEPPPKGPGPDGIWRRRYENGLVLVNPNKLTPVQVAVGEGWRRPQGRQDPELNDGQPVTTVRLGAREGAVLLRR